MSESAQPPPSAALTEARQLLRVGPEGAILEGAAGDAAESQGLAAAATALARALEMVGEQAGFTTLQVVTLRSPRRAWAAGARADGLWLASVDPAKGTATVEKALHAWAVEPPSSSRGAAAQPSGARPAARVELPAATPPPVARAPAPAERAAVDAAGADDPWSPLRRALARGQLTEAAALGERLRGIPAASAGGRPGCEPMTPAEHERALRVLLDGVGSAILGDGAGAGATLRPLVDASTPNLSVRWLALQWSARAAMRGGSFAAAKVHLREALLVSRQLDVHARAVTQWTAAEVLASDGDTGKALAWLVEARGRFERLADRWGVARTLLAEARVLASTGREDEAAEAARRAAQADAAWEEPPVFLASRALMRGAPGEAEEILRAERTPAADRVRALIQAVTAGVVSAADACAYLRECDAPPCARTVQALERIATASPGFLPARETLAWMLLKVGRHAEANALFRALLDQQLSPADRASVMLGLGCLARAQQAHPPAAAPRERDRAAPAPSPLPSPAPVAESAAPVFAGRLDVLAPPDLLEFLRSTRRTGLLVCSSPAGMGALRFRRGCIVGGDCAGAPHVGEVLGRAGAISAEAMRTLQRVDTGTRTNVAIGELLVRDGLADAATVRAALERVLELTVRELVQWSNGEFTFTPEETGAPAATGSLGVELDVQAVLLNVFKELDEQARDAAGARAGS